MPSRLTNAISNDVRHNRMLFDGVAPEADETIGDDDNANEHVSVVANPIGVLFTIGRARIRCPRAGPRM
jgi:hypothetical protein